MTAVSRGCFSLIELAVSGVFLGVLATFTVPRFLGPENQARAAAVNALAGDIKGAAALAHSTQLTSGGSPATSITVGGDTVAMANGYPTLTSLPLVLEATTGHTYDATLGVYTRTDASTAVTCTVTYIAPATNGVVPTVAVVTRGC